MSRLYAKMTSDNGDTPRTISGHEFIYIEIYYGDRQDSELFKRIIVKWTKRMKEPKVMK